MHTQTDPQHDVGVAVVGAGPAGFYAAQALLRELGERVRIDMIERQAAPFGLVRGGVAPDHQKVKSVTRVFEKVAASPRFRYFGGVQMGRDVHRADLLSRYHAVVYAMGAEDDRALGVPGEGLPGCVAARAFVGWYNGHPDFPDDVQPLDAERAVVVGNGNVALDVARMLVSPLERIAATDIADHALSALALSRVREVVVLGRRGPAQAAFTAPELRELGEIPGVDVELVTPSGIPAATGDSAADRTLEALRMLATRPATGAARRIVLRFQASPIAIRGTGRAEAVVVAENALRAGADGRVAAHPTSRTEVIPAGMVVRAVGYRGRAIPGLPFDPRSGVIPNLGGRLLDDGRPRPGEYVAGWIKRGPSGVIGTNRRCAEETVAALLADLSAGLLTAPPVPLPGQAGRLFADRVPGHLTWDHWLRLDAIERAEGARRGRPRRKVCSLSEARELLGIGMTMEARRDG